MSLHFKLFHSKICHNTDIMLLHLDVNYHNNIMRVIILYVAGGKLNVLLQYPGNKW